MKKILSILMTAAFVLAFGTAYPAVLSNGITDFSGKSYEPFVIVPAVNPVPLEGSQDGTMTAHNGVTDFGSGTYDAFAIVPSPAPENTVEGMAAGGLRPDHAPANGITDFNWRARDRGEIDR